MSKKTYKANIAKLKSNPVGKASPDAVYELEGMAREVPASARVSKIAAGLVAGGETISTEIFFSTGQKGGFESAAKRKITPDKLERWQSDAEAIWENNKTLSNSEVARRIAGDGESSEHIRKRIVNPY